MSREKSTPRKPHPQATWVTAVAISTVLLLSAGFFNPSGAQDAREEQRRRQLRSLDEEIRLLQNRITSLQASEKTASRTLEEHRTKRRLHLREVERLGLEILSLEARIAELDAQTAELSDSLQRRRGRLGTILRKMYARGRQGVLRRLLKVSDAQDIGLAQSYLSLLARREAAFIDTYKADITKLGEKQNELRDSRAELLNMREDERRHSESALAAQREQERLLVEIRSKRGIYGNALQERIQARRELQELIEMFAAAAPGTEASIAFGQLRGSLPWPCRGEIITAFGMVRDPIYDVVLANDGIDISAPLGTPVRAVFDGKVVFRDWINACGNTIVLDHGNGYYTLYAHLDRFSIEKGDKVSSGQKVGDVGETGSLKGPILHFEIRKRAEPLNPADWLKKQP